MLPCHEVGYPSFSCESKPSLYSVRDVVEAATGKVILGGRGGRERGTGSKAGRGEKGGGEAARSLFFYTVRASVSSLSMPSYVAYKSSLPGETAEWDGSGVYHEAWWPSSIPKSSTVKGREWLQTYASSFAGLSVGEITLGKYKPTPRISFGGQELV